MASKKPSMIDALRAKHDPHYQLAGKVESLGKDIPIQLAQLHKTLSKSFAMQRKTLTRVLGLEKKVAELEEERAVEEQAKKGIDDILGDIRGEEDEEFDAAHATPEEVEEYNSSVPMTDEEKEFVGEESKFDAQDKSVSTKTKPKKKKPKIKAKKIKIDADKFRKGTAIDDGFKSRVMGEDEKGGYLSPEDRKFRFKRGNDGATVDPSKLLPTDENQEGEASGPVKDILSSVVSIEETLNSQYQLQLEGAKEQKEEAEKKRRGAREKMLEGAGKIWDGIKSTGEKVIKPFQSIWSKILGFIQTIFFGRIFYKILEWMGNKDNQGKIQSIIKFFKDWWPMLLTAYLLFGNAFGRMAVKLGVTVTKFAVKLVTKLIPKMLAGLAKLKAGKILKGGLIGGALLGAGVIAGKMMSGGKDEGSPDLQPTGEDTPPVEAEGGGLIEKYESVISEFKEGGFVSGPGGVDKVPARLTAGEFVMSKGAVQKYGVNTLANMNAAGGGTNRPTIGRYNEGGKVQTMSEKLGHTRGTVTDPKEKKAQEDYMLEWVNKERVEFLGLPPLDKLTYADGVELTKEMGADLHRVKEESHTDMDFDNMIKTTSRSKTVGDKTIFEGSMGLLTEEDKQQYLASNPGARMMLELKEQVELDALGADISASAKMNGGGLVQGLQGGGLVQGFQGGGQVRQMGRGASNNRMKLSAQQKRRNTPGTSSGKKTTVAYQDQGGSMKSAGGARQPGNKELPSFSATAMRSPDKIRVLGISV
mgnify:CR=1 FL=1|tara:strand:+ start:1705 stop:3972 length:2268 start_codon:yes stop_codon:yes gene_type:complete